MKQDCIIKKACRFLKYSKHKGLIVRALFYSAYYRFCIKFRKPEKLRKNWGESGMESPIKDDTEKRKYISAVGYAVNKVCTRTVWESKCLVRALTAQKLLIRKGIHSTLYLGLSTEHDKLVAHAWLRVGSYFVTGGCGQGYTVVDKYFR